MEENVLDIIMKFKYGGMSENELLFIMELCKDKKVLELGSMVGQSSYAIASVSNGVDCVDVWSDDQEHLSHDKRQAYVYKSFLPNLNNMYNSFCTNCNEFIQSGKIRMHRGRTKEIAKTFEKEEFDVILIDADHSYYGVSNDFFDYEEKLKKDGLFVFHDYGDSMWVDIKKFCNEMENENRIKKISQRERIAVFQKTGKGENE